MGSLRRARSSAPRRSGPRCAPRTSCSWLSQPRRVPLTRTTPHQPCPRPASVHAPTPASGPLPRRLTSAHRLVWRISRQPLAGGTPLTVATAFKPEARRNRLVQLLRSYPLLSYFVIAYAITAAYDFLVMVPNPDFPSFPRDFGP